VLILAWLWVGAVVFGRVFTGILISSLEDSSSGWSPFILALIQAGLVGLPLIFLSRVQENRAYRGVFQAWIMAAVFGGVAAPILLTPPYAVQLHAVLHVAVAGVYLLLVWLLSGRISSMVHPNRPRLITTWIVFPAITAAVIFAYPWLAWGALGSVLDTLLQILAALSLGLAAGFTSEAFIFRHTLDEPGLYRGPQLALPRFVFTGLSVGTTVLIIFSGTGFGYHVMQLLLMVSLPSLGFAASGFILLLLRSKQPISSDAPSRPVEPYRWLLAALTIGLSAAAPMTLIDPAELILFASLGPGELLQWGMSAAILSSFFTLFLSIFLLVLVIQSERRKASGPAVENARNPVVLGGLAGAALLSALLVYWLLGQPGFHGDGLFVILEDQLETTSAAGSGEGEARRAGVYQELVAHAAATQAPLWSILDRYGIDYTPYYLVNGLAVQGGPLMRLWLSGRPGVDRVLSNPWMRPLPEKRPPTLGTASPPATTPWNLTLIGVDRVWEEFGITGEGIVVGHSDSGVQWDHPELSASYRGAGSSSSKVIHDYQWYDPWYGTLEPVDISGHGTHTLGSIVGSVVGAAPGATWFACANLSRNLGNPALYLDCMQFMLAPFPLEGDPFRDGQPDLGAHVINNSWSCPEVEGCDAETLLDSIRALRSAGIFIVASAGNDGPGCETLSQPPAIYAEAFSVGAIDRNGNLAPFSSIGPVTVDGSGRVKPDITAPGFEVLSTLPGSTYGVFSGTSMAGPHVTGVVALMWSANPNLIGDIQRTEQILRESAQPFEGSLPNCPGAQDKPSTATGYGILNAYRAVELALEE
jgi:hypothetical protein